MRCGKDLWSNTAMDRGSILRVWLPLVLGLYAVYFVFVQGPGPRDSGRWVGLAACLVGLSGVMLGRYTLGRSFSITAKAVALVTTGIYSRIRNPIYVSSVIFILGLIVMMRRAAWLALLLIIIIPMQILRARREARVLEAKFGDAYRQYRSRTWF
jgi:protein-S-isoprenylcysteine O-methyltransferase Ste14